MSEQSTLEQWAKLPDDYEWPIEMNLYQPIYGHLPLAALFPEPGLTWWSNFLDGDITHPPGV